MGHRQDPRKLAPPTEYGPSPRQSAHNVEGYPREGGFTHELGFGHVPGQRWGGGYGGDAIQRLPDGPPSGRGFTGSDFGPPRDPRRDPPGHGMHGTDMGMGERVEERGTHFGKGPKGYQRSDARIHDDVCEAIANQGHIDATNVEVRVEDGVLTLTGTVHERRDKRGLEQIVEHTRGVHDVHNEIRLARSGAGRERAAAPAAEPAPSEPKNGKSLRS